MRKDSSRVNEIRLSDSLWVRFTTSVSHSSSKYQSVNGYYNSTCWYLYMPSLKKRIGREWRATSPVLKKQLTDDGKPLVLPLSDQDIQIGLENLFRRNVGISLLQKKEIGIKTFYSELNESELVVFWLHRYNDIAELDTSVRTDIDRQKVLAKLCRTIGGFDLSSLSAPTHSELDGICHRLASDIKKALGHDDDVTTSSIRDKVQIIRFAIKLYMLEKDLDPTYVLERLIRESTPPKSTRAKIIDNMRIRSLPIEKYRDLYTILKNSSTNCYSVALLFMLFLGLSAEEACGLNVGSVSQITGYSGCYQITIIQQYCRINRKLVLSQTLDEDDFRNIPVPEALYLCCKPMLKCTSSAPLFTDDKGKRLKPNVLKDKLEKLLASNSNKIIIRDGTRVNSVDLSFLSTSYRESCRILWRDHCGLSAGEVRYLGGLTPPDTASAHYIDYNNATKQYRMLKQLEYGIAMIANTGDKSPDCFNATAKPGLITGGLESRVSVLLLLKEPVNLAISSRRGLLISKGHTDE